VLLPRSSRGACAASPAPGDDPDAATRNNIAGTARAGALAASSNGARRDIRQRSEYSSAKWRVNLGDNISGVAYGGRVPGCAALCRWRARERGSCAREI